MKELERLIAQYEAAMLFVTKNEGNIKTIAQELMVKDQFINEFIKTVKEEKTQKENLKWIFECITTAMENMQIAMVKSQPIPKEECKCNDILQNKIIDFTYSNGVMKVNKNELAVICSLEKFREIESGIFTEHKTLRDIINLL
jgi:ABC-type sugar transport system ATPase subunit